MMGWENATYGQINALAAAIVKQAVDDWRYLKKNRKQNGCKYCRREDIVEIEYYINGEEIPAVYCPSCGELIDEIDERDCNYRELINFFKHDCDKLLTGTGLTADRIYRRLRQEGKVDKT